MPVFNVGIIGVGYWGKKVAYEYSRIKNVRLVAVCDIVDKNSLYCKERFGVVNHTSDYRELLNMPEIKGVHISTPNDTHYMICKAALEAGKHVLTEKPLSLNSKQAYELVQLAEKQNLTLSVGHIYRFNNAVTELKRLIAENFFGKIFEIEFIWQNLETHPDRDVISDLTPHPFDMLNYLLNDWPVQITCKARPYTRKELEEAAYVVAEFKNGIMAHLNVSWLFPKKTRSIWIIGESKTAHADAATQDVTIYESNYTYKLGIQRNNTIRDELIHFIQSVGDPLTETKNSGCIGAKVVEMIEACWQSNKTGQTVNIVS